MEALVHLLNVNTIFFTIFDYPMSYIEFFGTIFSVWCVWLTVRARVLSWPVGIVGVVLYIFLFYQIQLYSDLFEQGYFLVTSFWGWWLWTHPKTKAQEDKNRELKISWNSARENAVYAGVIVALTATLAYVTANLTTWLPAYFPEPASYVFFDALTTALSFTAQWLLAKKRIESWVLWIVVDAIDVWIYWFKGVHFVALEYGLFFFLASKGLYDWLREYQKANVEASGMTSSH